MFAHSHSLYSKKALHRVYPKALWLQAPQPHLGCPSFPLGVPDHQAGFPLDLHQPQAVQTVLGACRVLAAITSLMTLSLSQPL